MSDFLKIGLVIAATVLVILSPLAVVWALNVLFPVLAIPYTWQTWLSVLILGGLLKSKVSVKKD